MTDMRKRMEEEWVINRLAKRIYVNYCKDHGYEWEGRSPDSFCHKYAATAIEYLGWDEEAIKRLVDDAELDLVA